MYYQNSDGTFTRDAIEQVQDGDSYDFALPKHDIAPLIAPHFATFDYNNDGLLDLLVCGVLTGNDITWHKDRIPRREVNSEANNENTTVWMVTLIYRNDGDGNFTYLENTGLPVIYVDHGAGGIHKGHSPLKIPFAVGDYDHDGYVDIAMMGKEVSEDGRESDLVGLYRNNGDGTFTKKDIVDGNQPFHAVRQGNVHFADLNNDGWLDLVFDGWYDSYDLSNMSGGGSGWRVYINNQGESFTDATGSFATASASRGAGTAVADYDKDGYLDVFNVGYCDNYGWGSFCFHNTTGDNGVNFERIDIAGKGVGQTEHLNIFAKDFDGDGNIDIIFDGQDENHIYYGKSDGSFERLEQLPVRTNQTHKASMAIGDVTGNGMPDRFETGYSWVHDDYRAPLGYSGDWNLVSILWENKQPLQLLR